MWAGRLAMLELRLFLKQERTAELRRKKLQKFVLSKGVFKTCIVIGGVQNLYRQWGCV